MIIKPRKLHFFTITYKYRQVITSINRQNNMRTVTSASSPYPSGEDVFFFVFMEKNIRWLEQTEHHGTSVNYRAALSSFKRFRRNTDIRICLIDHVIIEEYQAYLSSRGLSLNSISFYMRILRAVYRRTVELEITIDRNIFRHVFTGNENTLKRAISYDSIRKLRDIDLSSRPDLEYARDIFLFLFFCRGMSFIDAAFLKKSDVRYGTISYRRHKTGKLLHIKIVHQIEELIKRHTPNDSPYLLSIIGKPMVNERRQYETSLRRTNNALRILGTMIGLPIPLTTYVSRHTWATIAKSRDIPVNVISDALGHNSLATTQIYLASIDNSVIDRANEIVIGEI